METKVCRHHRDMTNMDATGDTKGSSASYTPSMVFLTFLQMDCQNDELKRELNVLEKDFKHVQNIKCNDEDDGEIQTDGHSIQFNLQELVQDNHPIIGPPEPAVPIHDPAVRDVARELMVIADQLENSVMAHATDGLLRSLLSSNIQQWSSHLTQAVECAHGALRHGCGGLDDLPQERVLLALSLSLIKGVCERTPHFLCHLFRIWQQSLS